MIMVMILMKMNRPVVRIMNVNDYCENDYYDDHDCWQNLYDRNELVDLIEETLRS